MATPARLAVKQAKPILSRSHEDARRRVISLYKAWYRQIPNAELNYDLPKSQEECVKKLRQEFRRYDNVTDLRIIDMLIIKGQMELQEVAQQWKPLGNLMNYWRETVNPKPKDFMSKFISGQD